MAVDRKQAVVSCLCKRLSLDPKSFSGDAEKSDIKSLCNNILKSSEKGAPLLNNEEVMKWMEFANNFPVDSTACIAALNGLNDELSQKSVLVGNGLRLTEVDVIVYSVIHSSVITIPRSDRQKLPHVLRWMDYVQNKEDLEGILAKISVEKARFEPQVAKGTGGAESNAKSKEPAKGMKGKGTGGAESNAKSKEPAKGMKGDEKAKDAAKGSKDANGPEADRKSKKDSALAKSDEAAAEVTKPEKEAAPKDEVPVTVLNIQVGLIRKAWKHPSADSLLVEEIDVGEPKVRQVVSGLAKYCSPDDLVNRHVVLITNVKPGKLRDVVSEGLVLCASNEDHSVVQPLCPPEGAKPGERVSFAGHDGKPEDVLNPKKKQLDKITPHLYTDESGVATYKGIPFMTSAGPCTSSIPKATIK